jgi:hypothetical protein
MAAKLTRMTHNIMIQLHLVAESSSHSKWPVQKLLNTPSYKVWYLQQKTVDFKELLYASDSSLKKDLALLLNY